MGDRASLLEFGFSAARVDAALRETKNSGLQPALDWLEKHADTPEDKLPGPDAAGSTEGDAEMDDAEAAKLKAAENAPSDAKSLVCLVCGKKFRNHALASFHGDKSGHDQFEESTEEIKPLTEEEKKAKLEELRAAMATKRAAREKQEAADNKQNEALRRKGGKEMANIKEEMKLREAEKEAAKRKQDKIDEAKAKARVKEQIAEDKKRRADQLAAAKAAREGLPPPSSSAAPSGPSTVSQVKASTGSTPSDQCRLQLRLPSGNPIVTTMPSSNRLASVGELLRSEHGWQGSLSFSTTFPRRVFSPAEMARSLQELGLTPSSVLVVQP